MKLIPTPIRSLAQQASSDNRAPDATTAGRPSRGIVAALWAMALVLVSPHLVAVEPSGSVASFRTTVTDDEFESWIAFLGPDSSGDRDRALDQLVLTLRLAHRAEIAGLPWEPGVRIELARAQAKVFRPLLRKHVYNSVEIAPRLVEEKYLAIKDTYARPRRLRLRNIFLAYPPDSGPKERAAVRQRMEAIESRLRDGADFSAEAEAESDSQTRLQGGLIGNVSAGTLRPAVDAVAMSMKAGDISEIIEGSEGLTILDCERELEAVERTPGEIRDAAQTMLVNVEFKQRWRDLENTLLERTAPDLRLAVLNGDEGDDQVLVRYSDGVLSVSEVRRLILGETSHRSLSDIPAQRIIDQTNAFLIRNAMQTEARALGLVTPEVESRRYWTRCRVLAAAMIVNLIQDRMKDPTDEEVREFFEANGAGLERPGRYLLAVIVLPMNRDDPRPAYAEGNRIVHEIESGELAFADAARCCSLHETAADGGEVGWVARPALSRRLGIDVAKAVVRLAPGENTGIVEDDGSLWIVELRGLEERRSYTVEEAAPVVRNLLGNHRVAEFEKEIALEWLHDAAVDPVDPPDASAAD